MPIALNTPDGERDEHPAAEPQQGEVDEPFAREPDEVHPRAVGSPSRR